MPSVSRFAAPLGRSRQATAILSPSPNTGVLGSMMSTSRVYAARRMAPQLNDNGEESDMTSYFVGDSYDESEEVDDEATVAPHDPSKNE
jgi:hypothetical protein